MTTTTNQTLTEQPTGALTQLLAGNDQRGFSKLYDLYSASVYGLITTWVRDAEVAENLLQDVFLKVWRNRQQYDETKGSLFTWLYNITRNICIDHLRSKAYKYFKASQLSNDLSLLLPKGLMTGNRNPDTIGLCKLINTLNKGEKQVIELMYFKGYTQKEIAQIMDTPLGTVKTRVSRAIKNLRCFFEKDWKETMEHISLN